MRAKSAEKQTKRYKRSVFGEIWRPVDNCEHFDESWRFAFYLYHTIDITDIAIYLQVFFCGHSSHGSPHPAPMVQQHTDFLISRPLGLVQPSSSNLSKQKPIRTSVGWNLRRNIHSVLNWTRGHKKEIQTSGQNEQWNKRMKGTMNERKQKWTNESGEQANDFVANALERCFRLCECFSKFMYRTLKSSVD